MACDKLLSLIWLLVLLACSTSVLAGETFYNFGDFYAATMKVHENTWFRASPEEIIRSTLIDSQPNCMHLCFKETSCQSFNIVSSGPREYFCTLTTIHFMDPGVERVSAHGHRNFSFQKRR
ncbi:uncharacterized protein LOC130622338 [Hydractinia symbiolongicarpus]|uniref:uncharacterized protein LOC130622338 n=1 Tax=Hydractinia symbiolongicarpus TaxID=13093 RepID=UPI00254FC630|nr:uncharacterized protein LOC130622338 [Hydractinia symbiolongicarpus]